MVDVHFHNGIDTNQLDAKEALIGAPQAALTSATGGSLTSGGSNDLKTADSTILTNLITRVGELETRLRNLGLLS